MASPGHSFLNRLKRFLTPKNAKEAKEKAPKGQGRPQYGKSFIENALPHFHALRELQKTQFHQSWSMSSTTTVTGDCDEPAEVFLDENGQIREPLERGIAYDFCKLDRWYMPDCVPGIVSRVDITHAGRYCDLARENKTRIITVLHANDRYIHLAPQHVFYLEPNDHYYADVVAHFARRGIEHIREGSVSSKDWDKWAKTFGTTNGQRNQKTGTTSTGSSGGRNQNPPRVAWGFDPAEGESYSAFTFVTREETWVWTSKGP